MTRPLRVNVADGWYHCMHRGIERRTIFEDERDHRRFLELLGEVCERFRVRVHAYCLLGNHYHLIVQTPDANLSRAMQWLGISYSSWFNARHDRSGPLFQGRFKSIPVEDGAWVYELSLYVHLNPVRTMGYGLDKHARNAAAMGMTKPPTQEQVSARLKKLRSFPWSSYRAYAGFERGPKWLTTSAILRRASRRTSDRHSRYREQVSALVSSGVDASRLELFREVVGIGSVEFVELLRRGTGLGNRETERRGRLRQQVSFADVVTAVEEWRGEDADVWLHKHGDWGKWLVLNLARRYSGMTLQELGNQMGGMDYAAVSVGLRRFDSRLKQDRKMRGAFKNIVEMLNV